MEKIRGPRNTNNKENGDIERLCVMISLGCQVDWMWNPLRDKLVGIPVRDFLDQVIWSGKIHLKYGWQLLVTAQVKGGLRESSASSLLAFSVPFPVHQASPTSNLDWGQWLSMSPLSLQRCCGPVKVPRLVGWVLTWLSASAVWKQLLLTCSDYIT